jgi:hypothetical protein
MGERGAQLRNVELVALDQAGELRRAVVEQRDEDVLDRHLAATRAHGRGEGAFHGLEALGAQMRK